MEKNYPGPLVRLIGEGAVNKKIPNGFHRTYPSDALRAALLVLLALGHDSGAKTSAEIIGQFVELGVAVNFDGFLGGVADNIAIVAPREMVL
jgi:hypothetical protein